MTKTSSTGSAGVATSTNGYNGDVGAKFTTTSTSDKTWFSVIYPTTGANPAPYGIWINPSSVIYIYENGSSKGSFGTYTAGDDLEISRSGTTVTYDKNGSTFYTSTLSSTGTFIMDMSMDIYGSQMEDARWTGVSSTHPAVIVDVTGTIGAGEVTLSWTAPHDNGATITGYDVQYGTVVSGTFGLTYNDDSTPGATISGLSNSTAYQFRVVATNANGSSMPSNVVRLFPGGDNDVVWTDLVGVSAAGNDLTKTGGSAWGNGGAASTYSYNGDIGFDFSVAETNTYRMAGFSESNADANYTSIEYAIYLLNNGTVRIYESGSDQGSYGTYQNGDVFSVQRIGTTIYYLKNGEELDTSTVSGTIGLMADTALYTSGATINDGRLYGTTLGLPGAVNDLAATAYYQDITLDWTAPTNNGAAISQYTVQYGTVASGTFGSTYVDDGDAGVIIEGLDPGTAYQFRIIATNSQGNSTVSNTATITTFSPKGFEVIWTDVVGVTEDGNDLTKYGSTQWGNSGTASEQSYGGDVQFVFKTAETNTYKIMGLSDSNVNEMHNTIDYGLYFKNNGSFVVMENGTEVYSMGTYTVTGTYMIERAGSAVKYYADGSLGYTSTVSSSGDLMADTAFYSAGATIINPKFVGIAEPDPVDDLIALTGDEEIDLSWTAPAANGSAITGYEVQYGTVASGTFGMSYSDDATPGATITGLTNGTPYQFRVVTENAISESLPSNAVQHVPFDYVDVVWTNAVGVSVSGNDLTKTASAGYSNAGATSTAIFFGNVAFEFTATEDDSARTCGLSSDSSDEHYITIDFGIRLYDDATFEVSESGTSVTSSASYSAGDTFGVVRSGTTIMYLHNGSLIYTSGATSNMELLVDSSLYDNGATITDARVAGSSTELITSVGHTVNLIDPDESDTTTINFTLAQDSTVTIDIYETTYNAVLGTYTRTLFERLLDEDSRSAGSNTYVWDGEDNSSNVADSGVYVYTIQAEGAAGTYLYDPEYINGTVTISNADLSPESFDAHRGETTTISFDLLVPAWVLVRVGIATEVPVTAELVTWEPMDTTGNAVIWDGHDDLGNIVDDTEEYIGAIWSRVIPENGIIVKNNASFALSEVYADPIAFFPKYEEITSITYELTEDADVTLSIVNPSDQTVRTLVNNESKTAGSYTVVWDGKDSSGYTVAETGEYTIKVEFTQGPTTKVRNGIVTVF